MSLHFRDIDCRIQCDRSNQLHTDYDDSVLFKTETSRFVARYVCKNCLVRNLSEWLLSADMTAAGRWVMITVILLTECSCTWLIADENNYSRAAIGLGGHQPMKKSIRRFLNFSRWFSQESMLDESFAFQVLCEKDNLLVRYAEVMTDFWLLVRLF